MNQKLLVNGVFQSVPSLIRRGVSLSVRLRPQIRTFQSSLRKLTLPLSVSIAGMDMNSMSSRYCSPMRRQSALAIHCQFVLPTGAR